MFECLNNCLFAIRFEWERPVSQRKNCPMSTLYRLMDAFSMKLTSIFLLVFFCLLLWLLLFHFTNQFRIGSREKLHQSCRASYFKEDDVNLERILGLIKRHLLSSHANGSLTFLLATKLKRFASIKLIYNQNG